MRLGLTVRGLIVLVALASVGLAAFRPHPAFGCFATSVLLLAFIRTSRRIDQRRAMGSPKRFLGVIRSFLDSIIVVTAILEASLMPGLCLLPITTAPYGPTPTLLGVMISALLGIPIAILFRRRFW